jgi:hypothetical protein
MKQADHNEIFICAIFQDEAPFLGEWIEFRRMLGAEHFWLYNNNSTDTYLSVLGPYIERGPWISKNGERTPRRRSQPIRRPLTKIAWHGSPNARSGWRL